MRNGLVQQKVRGVDGSKVRVNYAGYERTIHKARIQPYTSERNIIDDVDDIADSIHREKNDDDINTCDDKESTVKENYDDTNANKHNDAKKNDDDINDSVDDKEMKV